ncbi:hypothetical protein BDK51DRAFT_27811 [Blyttiomyces helicus]|uniref:Uncharacterized protein n=1 Tax=Blyttiomyces helicus TaxID=388810 RepID=A0A4P9W9H3_9FUNG|nr:hypothetical protein BDK51DRAFT_27811 [Blyttiomyces helicus]|eukprot:RKO89211.1 hypothetical protein BDK51DRAFT_27811 [Blyttiomyces helicus]
MAASGSAAIVLLLLLASFVSHVSYQMKPTAAALFLPSSPPGHRSLIAVVSPPFNPTQPPSGNPNVEPGARKPGTRKSDPNYRPTPIARASRACALAAAAQAPATPSITHKRPIPQKVTPPGSVASGTISGSFFRAAPPAPPPAPSFVVADGRAATDLFAAAVPVVQAQRSIPLPVVATAWDLPPPPRRQGSDAASSVAPAREFPDHRGGVSAGGRELTSAGPACAPPQQGAPPQKGAPPQQGAPPQKGAPLSRK